VTAKWVVCPCCRGEGTLDDYGAFTSEHLDEWYGDGPERDEFLEDYRSGRIGRKICGFCGGKRVVEPVDEDRLTAEERWAEEQEYAAMIAAEQRYGGI